jgi:hypothetical protein
MNESLQAPARAPRRSRAKTGEDRGKGLPFDCCHDLLALHRGQLGYPVFLERWGGIVEKIGRYFKDRRCYVSHEVEDLVQFALGEIAVRVATWDPVRDPHITDQTNETQLAGSIGRFIYYGVGKVITQEIKRAHSWPKKGGKDGERKKAPLVHYPTDFQALMGHRGEGEGGTAAQAAGALPYTMGAIRSALSDEGGDDLIQAIDVHRVLAAMSELDRVIFAEMFEAHADSRSLLGAAEELCQSGDPRLIGVRPDGVVRRYEAILRKLDPDAPSRVRGLNAAAPRHRRRKESQRMQSSLFMRPAVLQSYQVVFQTPAPARAKTTELIDAIQAKFAARDPLQLQPCAACERAVAIEFTSCAFCGAAMPQGAVAGTAALGAPDEDPKVVLARLESFEDIRAYVTRRYVDVLEATWHFAQVIRAIHDEKTWRRWGHVSFQNFITDCKISHGTAYAYLQVAQKFTKEQFLACEGEYTKLSIIASATGAEQDRLVGLIQDGATQRELQREMKRGRSKTDDDVPGAAGGDDDEQGGGEDVDPADQGAPRATPPMPEESRPPAPAPGRGGREVGQRAVSTAMMVLTEPQEIPMLSRKKNGGMATEFDPDDSYLEVSLGTDDEKRPVVMQIEFQTDELGNIMPLVVRHVRIAEG